MQASVFSYYRVRYCVGAGAVFLNIGRRLLEARESWTGQCLHPSVGNSKPREPRGTDAVASASGHWWASAQLGLELQTGTASWGAGLNWRPLSTERSAHGPNCYCQLAAMRPGAMRFDNIFLSKHFKYLLIRLKVTTNPFHCGPRRFGSQSNHKMLIFSPILGHISASGHWHCLYRGAEGLNWRPLATEFGAKVQTGDH